MERKSEMRRHSDEDCRTSVPKSGLKMVFAMSNRKKEEDKTIKVITRKDNRLTEDVIEEADSEIDHKDLLPGTIEC